MSIWTISQTDLNFLNFTPSVSLQHETKRKLRYLLYLICNLQSHAAMQYIRFSQRYWRIPKSSGTWHRMAYNYRRFGEACCPTSGLKWLLRAWKRRQKFTQRIGTLSCNRISETERSNIRLAKYLRTVKVIAFFLPTHALQLCRIFYTPTYVSTIY
jgi:hypothetical protein